MWVHAMSELHCVDWCSLLFVLVLWSEWSLCLHIVKMGERVIYFSQKCSDINFKGFFLLHTLQLYVCILKNSFSISYLFSFSHFSLHKIGVYWFIYVSIYNTVYLLCVYRMLLLFPSTRFPRYSGKSCGKLERKSSKYMFIYHYKWNVTQCDLMFWVFWFLWTYLSQISLDRV